MKFPWIKKKEPPVLTLTDRQIYNLTIWLNVWVAPSAIDRLAWYSLLNNMSSVQYVSMWIESQDLSVTSIRSCSYRDSLCLDLINNDIVPKSHLTAAVNKAIVLLSERVEKAKLSGVGIDFMNSIPQD